VVVADWITRLWPEPEEWTPRQVLPWPDPVVLVTVTLVPGDTRGDSLSLRRST